MLINFYSEPPFHIRLLNSSPRVSGGVVMIDFETSMPVLSAKCFLTGQRQRDCEYGSMHGSSKLCHKKSVLMSC